MQGTVVGGFAIQNNGGQLRALNDPAAHLLKKVVQHARLTMNITSVMQLWQEYKVGLYGYKPAEQFTMDERNLSRGMTQMCYRRNKVWALTARMVHNGYSAQVAINRIHAVYGSNISITELIKKITIDGGDHPNLR